MQIEKWSVISGDYVEDQINDDPYEIVKRNRKLKRIMLNLFYSIFAAGLLILVLFLLTNLGSKG